MKTDERENREDKRETQQDTDPYTDSLAELKFLDF